MKKKLLIIMIFVVLIISSILVYFFVFNKDKKTTKKKEKITYTDVKEDTNIKINNDLTLEFGDNKSLSDYITIDNSEFKDKEITYDELGTKKIEFSYKGADGKINYRFINIDVVDTTSPYASVPSYKKIKVNSDISFIDDFLCADNHDRVLEKRLDGEFDLLREGTYTVKFVAVDSSENKTEKTFILDVVAELPKPSSGGGSSQINYLNYSDLYNQYKNSNTKIGIDISRWQGDVDFKKLKENNVETRWTRWNRWRILY